MSDKFKCYKCKQLVDEICSFSGYGDERAMQEKIKNREYCEDCFDLVFEKIFKRQAMKEKSASS